MSHATPQDDTSSIPLPSDFSGLSGRPPSPGAPALTNHSDILLGLTTMLQTMTVFLAHHEADDDTRAFKTSDLRVFVRTITRTLDYIGPSPKHEDAVFRSIVPPEACDAASMSRAAATLDMTKVRQLLGISRISLEDLNSYAQLILAQQDEYRRAHRKSLPIDASAGGIYTPSEDEANKFVDDNPDVYNNFASGLRIEDYFHLLKAFTHESATDGKTSSKLLSMIGRYALKVTTYRMCYMNGESYAIAKERIHKFLEEDRLYDQALLLKIPEYIILGPECYNFDKEIVLQILYAIFGLYYSVQGESGIIHLNSIIKWYDISA